MDRIDFIGNHDLRRAIRRNQVSFPAQTPAFRQCGSRQMQVRMAQLYFLRGWSLKRIAARYDRHRAVVAQLLADWRIRAIRAGYIQDVRPEADFPLPRAAESLAIPVDEAPLLRVDHRRAPEVPIAGGVDSVPAAGMLKRDRRAGTFAVERF